MAPSPPRSARRREGYAPPANRQHGSSLAGGRTVLKSTCLLAALLFWAAVSPSVVNGDSKPRCDGFIVFTDRNHYAPSAKVQRVVSTADTWQKCCQECQKDPKCNAWTASPPGAKWTHPDTGDAAPCWLKFNVFEDPPRFSKDNAVSSQRIIAIPDNSSQICPATSGQARELRSTAASNAVVNAIVPYYQVYASEDYRNLYDFPCELQQDSAPNQTFCKFEFDKLRKSPLDSIAYLAKACNETEACRGFVYDSFFKYGILKGGEGFDIKNKCKLDGNTTLWLKGLALVDSSPASSEKKSVAPIAAGAAGGAVALITVLALAACFVIRRRKKRAQETINPRYEPSSIATGASNINSDYVEGYKLHFSDLPATTTTTSGTTNTYGYSSQFTPPSGSGPAAGGAAAAFPRSKDMKSGSMYSGYSGVAPGTGASGVSQNSNTSIESSVWIPGGSLRIVRHRDGSEFVLGEGSYGKVCKALLNDVEEVAAKFIKVDTATQKSVIAAEREVIVLKECMSQYVVRFLGAVVEDSHIVVVTEFCHGGDLWHALKSDRTGEYRWYQRGSRIALDIARGLHYLHTAKNIIHFDMKSPNVLLDRHGNAKIGDVGLSKILRDTSNNTISTGMGTVMWASPEQIMGHQCDFKADIWSLGIILWEICTGGETPVQSRFFRELRVPEECPASIAQLVKACRNPIPANRPSALDVFNAIAASLPPQ